MAAEPLTLGAAFMAGFLGSGHCLGMCGGMALLPSVGGSSPRIGSLALYNACRLISYAALGALGGALGAALGETFDVPRWSLILRFATGTVIVLIGLTLLTGRNRLAFAERIGARFWNGIRPWTQRIQCWPPGFRLAALGLLWGWLPCGLVYSLLLAASLSGSALDGASLMLAFGLGTLPSMAGLGLAGQSAMQRLRGPRFRRAAGVILVVSGIWLAAMPVQHALAPGEAGHHHHQGQAV